MDPRLAASVERLIPLVNRPLTSVAAVKGRAVRCVTAQHSVLLRSQLIYWGLRSRTRR